MIPPEPGLASIDHKVIQLFALVSEALSKSTHALLSGEALLGQSVIDGDQAVDSLTAEVELLIWRVAGAAGPRRRASLLGRPAPDHP